MTVAELHTRMSSSEFSEWKTYYKILASEQKSSSGGQTTTF